MIQQHNYLPIGVSRFGLDTNYSSIRRPEFLTGCFACVSKYLCHNKLIGDRNKMIGLSTAFASKALLNLSNLLVCILLVIMEFLSVHTVRTNSYKSSSKIHTALYYTDIDILGPCDAKLNTNYYISKTQTHTQVSLLHSNQASSSLVSP